MVERRHYKNAPIENALIDVQVLPAALVDLALLAAPPAEIREKYPESHPVISGNAQISLGMVSSANFQPSQIGYFRGSPSRPSSFQVRQNGLTANRSRPYESWEVLLGDFMELWNWFSSVTHVAQITRIGVRYVNRFHLPQPAGDFKRFFTTLPTIGDGLPGGLTTFGMQLQIPVPESSDIVILNQSMPPFAQGETPSVILDIDVVRPTPTAGSDVERVLNALHAIENKFFEDSITDVTRELIK